MDIVNQVEKEVRKYIEEYKNNSEDNYDLIKNPCKSL